MASSKRTKEKKAQVAPAGKQRALLVIFGAATFFAGLYQSIGLRWVSDDAFITFRYAQNVVAGNGFVYNIGEYVEGYTHFLWLLILSAVRTIGIDPVSASMWIGIVSYAALLLIYLAITRKEQLSAQRLGRVSFYFPLAAILLALNYDMSVWATGGLETSIYTLLISLAFYCWFYTELAQRTRLLLTGMLLLLVWLTRPDGALFTIAAVALLIGYGIKHKQSLKQLARNVLFLILPSLTIGVLYLIWKYNYYGDIFPATYYAKSADHSYFGQGFFYIWLFFRVYFSEILVLIVGALAWTYFRYSNRKVLPAQTPIAQDSGSPIIAASMAIVLYLVLYVAQVGGDFMFARFIIPVLPLLYFLLERIFERLPHPTRHFKIIAGICIVALLIIENKLRENVLLHVDANTGLMQGNWDDTGGGETRGIADERWVYTRKLMRINGIERAPFEVYEEVGKFYEPFFRDLPVTVVIRGAQNILAYYANFRTVINEFGLTDTAIAHMPITKRGRIGHEKSAPESYFIERNAHFQLFAIAPQAPKQRAYDMVLLNIPHLGLVQLVKMVTYDKAIVEELQRRFRAAGINPYFPDHTKDLHEFITMLPYLETNRIESEYKKLKQVFLDHYPDPQAQKSIEDFITLRNSGRSQVQLPKQ
jgi:hypothetical protein